MKGKKTEGVLWLIFCIVFLLITHILFTIPAPFSWLEHMWEAGDLITFVGTIVLGYVAYWQTNKANEVSDRLLRIEEARYKLELRPFIMITGYKAYAKNESDIIKNPDRTYISIAKRDKETDDVLCIEMELTNTTSSFITASFGGAITENEHNWGYALTNQERHIISIQPNGIGNIVFYAPWSFFDEDFRGSRIRLKFILENRLSKRYAERFTIIPTMLSCNTVGCSRDGKWFLSMFIQEYSICRFDKDKSGNIVEMEEEL
jgi:hypothetical protein